MTRFVRGLSLTRVQSIVATLAGIASIATFSLAQFARAANGQLVAVVQTAGTHRSVADATVEVLTPQHALVATLKPDAAGRVTRKLQEGVYVVRVSHPRYAAEVRQVQVQPQQTVEIRTTLRAGASSPLDRAVNSGLGAVRRALGF